MVVLPTDPRHDVHAVGRDLPQNPVSRHLRHPSDDRCVAVDGDELTCQEADWEFDDVGDIRRTALSLQENRGEFVVARDEPGDLRLGDQARGSDDARGDAVHTDAVFPDLDRNTAALLMA